MKNERTSGGREMNIIMISMYVCIESVFKLNYWRYIQWSVIRIWWWTHFYVSILKSSFFFFSIHFYYRTYFSCRQHFARILVTLRCVQSKKMKKKKKKKEILQWAFFISFIYKAAPTYITILIEREFFIPFHFNSCFVVDDGLLLP